MEKDKMSHKIAQKIAIPKQFHNKEFAISLIEKNNDNNSF